MEQKTAFEIQELTSDEYVLSMGPQHPATHGVLRILLRMDGEVVVNLQPDPGYIHSSIEKICENRKYDQVMPYTDRMDYLSAVSYNLAYALAVEKLMGLEVPNRGRHIRVILAEMNRIMSHLLWFAAYGIDMGALTPIWYAFRERENLITLIEMQTGNRLTHHALRIGGVKNDLPTGFVEGLNKFLENFNDMVDEYEALFIDNVIFKARTKSIGVLKKENAISYGVTGPNLRASGCDIDLRKLAPYSGYENFSFEVCSEKNGDSWDRCKIRMNEMRQSASILRQAIDTLPEGEISAKAPKIIKPTPGGCYAKVEGPRGEVGAYVVSAGTDKPYRVKFRSPSFSNLSALNEMCAGVKIADLVAIMGSLDIVIPEIDR
ncbi:MAG TPA: NADH-quinone oxidoreductase subunit D [bacterium]|nr:NADH-quinone oxidoreductase subunit D [bacterium]